MKMTRLVQGNYAIGGALAMGAHGYQRHTNDLDAFLLAENKLAWLQAAQKVGLIVDPVFRGIHYIAFFQKHGDPRIRIDLLFPSEEIEVEAVRHPVVRPIGNIRAKVFPIELLAADKFLSDRPEDQHDFEAMLSRGLFEPLTVAAMLAPVDKAAARRLQKRAMAGH
jgi:hypothetical protein